MFDEDADIKITSNGQELLIEEANCTLDYWVQLPRYFDFLDCLDGADNLLTIEITNDYGVTQVETFQSRSWAALGILCGSEAGSSSEESVGRDEVLIDEV